MLNCHLCDYYKPIAIVGKFTNNATAKCEFSGISFFADVENLDIESPCINLSYAEYEESKKEIKKTVNIFINEDWRYIYKKAHLKQSLARVAAGRYNLLNLVLGVCIILK